MLVQQEVPGLDVAVQDALVMSVLQRIGDLSSQPRDVSVVGTVVAYLARDRRAACRGSLPRPLVGSSYSWAVKVIFRSSVASLGAITIMPGIIRM